MDALLLLKDVNARNRLRETGLQGHQIPHQTQVLCLHPGVPGNRELPVRACDRSGISQPSLSAIMPAVLDDIIAMTRRYIGCPYTLGEQANIKRQFAAMSGFPDVIAVIDCTHVAIRAHATMRLDIKVNAGPCEALGIQRSFCTPYHPQTNGLAEELNGHHSEVLIPGPGGPVWVQNQVCDCLVGTKACTHTGPPGPGIDTPALYRRYP